MSQRRPTWIIKRSTQESVEAVLIEDVTKESVLAVHEEWEPFKQQALKENPSGRRKVARSLPLGLAKKAKNLDLLAFHCFGIEYDQTMQGLMLLSTIYRPGRLAEQKGKLACVHRLPRIRSWNLPQLRPMRVMERSDRVSWKPRSISARNEGLAGPSLHSLPQSDGFYSHYMTEFGSDHFEEVSLKYFEMSEKQVEEFPER